LFFNHGKRIAKGMKKATPKKRGGFRAGSGRRATGKDPTRTIRLSDGFIAKVDDWAAAQDDAPGRSAAIRRLVELGLTVRVKASPGQRLRAARADRAKELASKTIEKMIDPAAPAGERAQRRRRLIKGPSEFRENRVDQPKAKGR
jgi:hypothetical protein